MIVREGDDSGSIYHAQHGRIWVIDDMFLIGNNFLPKVVIVCYVQPIDKISVMPSVKVKIVRFVDSAFPGWVACVLHDAVGQDWEFIEKVPVVTQFSLDRNSDYPQHGLLQCEVVRRHTNENGHELCVIDTGKPDSIGATTGETQFEVSSHQLVEHKF